MPLGLRTNILHVPDLARAKEFYSKAFGSQPYFDEPFYVGFNIGGYELGLDPDPESGSAGPGGSVTYWGVNSLEDEVARFESAGAKLLSPAHDVGEGIRVASVADPFGNVIGLIENPHFSLVGHVDAGGSTTVAAASPAQSAKEMFPEAYEREHATTLKVLRAFPAEQSDFRPHERSNAALQLAWTFVLEERMMLLAIKGESVVGSGFPSPPGSWEKVLEAFQEQHARLLDRLRSAGESDYAGTVQFFVGPNKMGDIPTYTFLWSMLSDQIHHRGQLSVYLRMAGGKVPSIYGPSADEPWR
ncbi:MAG TPA: DinB family protein [Gemmatimonadaceae bacterium]|nr:DinB family protein [Gemmatimonadaceae bacterium]